jgi:hypothetical protein
MFMRCHGAIITTMANGSDCSTLPSTHAQSRSKGHFDCVESYLHPFPETWLEAMKRRTLVIILNPVAESSIFHGMRRVSAAGSGGEDEDIMAPKLIAMFNEWQLAKSHLFVSYALAIP